MWGFQQAFQWWMPLFGMGMILFMIATVGLVVWGIIRLTARGRDRLDTGETSAVILRNRLARGEISTEQFQELQDLLRVSDGKA